MAQIKGMAALAMTGLIFTGCSLLTSFEDAKNKFSISDNIVSPVVVQLDAASGCGSSVLNFSEPLPNATDEELIALIKDKFISIKVQNDSGVSVSLTDGTFVNNNPTSAGEYNITIPDAKQDRLRLRILFYNEINNQSLFAGQPYTAIVSVLFENNYFQVEELTVNLTVQ